MTWSYVLGLGAVSTLLAVLAVIAGGLWWSRDRALFHRLATWWGATLSRTLPFSVEVRGFEHAKGGPFVIAPNHQSMIDLLILYLLPVPFRTVVKRSWFYTPFGFSISAAGYIPTERSADPEGAMRVFERCKGWLDRGVSVLLFPEGKRSRSWSVKRFKRGAFELAERTGTPILPVAIAGSNDVSHPSSFRFAYAKKLIILKVLPPIFVDGRTSEALRDECRRLLSDEVGALRKELLEIRGQGPTRAG